jgi:hypothetical protein
MSARVGLRLRTAASAGIKGVRGNRPAVDRDLAGALNACRSFDLMAEVGNKVLVIPVICKTHFGNEQGVVLLDQGFGEHGQRQRVLPRPGGRTLDGALRKTARGRSGAQ